MDYTLDGIANRFYIGFDRTCPIRLPSFMSMTQNHSIISEYLQRETSLGRMQCLSVAAASSVHLIPVGAIPKQHRPGKWRLIVDLSSPSNASVNDEISPEWSILRFVIQLWIVCQASSYKRVRRHI